MIDYMMLLLFSAVVGILSNDGPLPSANMQSYGIRAISHNYIFDINGDRNDLTTVFRMTDISHYSMTNIKCFVSALQ